MVIMDARTRAMDFLRVPGKPDDWNAIDRLTAIISEHECLLKSNIDDLREDLRQQEVYVEWSEERNHKLTLVMLLICWRRRWNA